MLLVDSREPLVLKRALIATLGEEHIVTLALDSADYLLFDQDGEAVGIERKTISDFLASLSGTLAAGEERLGSQLDRMDATYPARILLLEGSYGSGRRGELVVGKRTSGWSHASFQMVLLSIQRRRGFYLLHTADQAGTVDTLRVLHTHVGSRSFSGTMSRTGRTQEEPNGLRAAAGSLDHRHRPVHP